MFLPRGKVPPRLQLHQPAHCGGYLPGFLRPSRARLRKIAIKRLAPSELTGALSSAVDVSFCSGSGLGAGEAFPTGSVESLGSSSTSIFSAISCLPLGCYSSRCSGRYDLPGACWPFYRLQPWPSRILIGASRSRDRLGCLASGWLAQERGVQPPGGGGLPFLAAFPATGFSLYAKFRLLAWFGIV